MLPVYDGANDLLGSQRVEKKVVDLSEDDEEDIFTRPAKKPVAKVVKKVVPASHVLWSSAGLC